MVAAALAIGTAVPAIYAAKRAGDANNRALAASERSDIRATDATRASEAELLKVERERLAAEQARHAAELAEAKASREAALQRDQQRWTDYLRVNEPQWRAGGQMLQSLYGMAGMRGAPPQAQMPAGPPPMMSSVPPAGGGGGLSLADLMGASVGTTPTTLATRAHARMAPPAPMAPPQGMNLASLMSLAQALRGTTTAPAIGMGYGD